EKKKGQQFEIVQKSREINRIGTSSGGRLIFSQTGDQLVVYAQNPDQNISNVNTEWKISVDGVEKHTFSETATAKDVKASIDKLKLKGQKFEIVKKSDEIRSAENDGVGKHNTPPITNLADTNNPTNPMKPAVQDQKKSVLPQTIGDKDG
ncbi:TPA: hypothetical protein QCX21_005999, partial [Bacillus toyonensis]|nr:hypothetical protein [Bacillus toyonensis]